MDRLIQPAVGPAAWTLPTEPLAEAELVEFGPAATGGRQLELEA
jgi:hypothetical protein